MNIVYTHEWTEYVNLLLQAIRDGNGTEMTTFIQDAEINECDDHGLAPLHYAVKLKHLKMINSLCEKGASKFEQKCSFV